MENDKKTANEMLAEAEILTAQVKAKTNITDAFIQNIFATEKSARANILRELAAENMKKEGEEE